MAEIEVGGDGDRNMDARRPAVKVSGRAYLVGKCWRLRLAFATKVKILVHLSYGYDALRHCEQNHTSRARYWYWMLNVHGRREAVAR
jgi:hypothetical protein